MGGPIWSAPIHDAEFLPLLIAAIQSDRLKTLQTHPRINGMISVIQEELNDVPLYYAIGKMCSILKLEMIPVLKFRWENHLHSFIHKPYRVNRFIANVDRLCCMPTTEYHFRTHANSRWKPMHLRKCCGTFCGAGRNCIRWRRTVFWMAQHWRQYWKRNRRPRTIWPTFIAMRIQTAVRIRWPDFQKILQRIGDREHVQR